MVLMVYKSFRRLSLSSGFRIFPEEIPYQPIDLSINILLKTFFSSFFFGQYFWTLLSALDLSSPDTNYKVWNFFSEVQISCNWDWVKAVRATELTAALLIWAAGTGCSHQRREGCRHFWRDRFGQLLCPNSCKLFKTNLAAMTKLGLNIWRCQHSYELIRQIHWL